MIDWSKGFSVSYIMTTLDRSTWTDENEFKITDGKITIDNDTDLIQSASVTTTEKVATGEAWVRIYLLAHQSGVSAKVPLFTGLAVSPERKMKGYHNEYSMTAYSVLKPASDVVLKLGYYVPKYSDASKIKSLLSCCGCPVVIADGSPKVSSDIVASDGDTNLDIIVKLLDALNWRMKIGGDGTVYILPYSDEPIVTFGPSCDVIETSVKDKYDWYDCPNVYYAVSDDNGSAIARDDDTESPLSTVNRGREIWKYDGSVELATDENIVEYAKRKLKEAQQPERTLSYTRRFFDGIQTTDVVRLNYSGHSLDGLYRITSQTMTLGYGCSVSEEVESIG